MEYSILIIGFILVLILGFAIGSYWQKSKVKNQEDGFKIKLETIENQYIQKIDSLEKLNNQKILALENSISELKNYQSKSDVVLENLRTEKNDMAVKLAKKETDYNNIIQKNEEQKEEVNQLQ